ncbi:MAG: hypothetical protein V7608_1962 [Hyphomicrobiales bacterium]
MRGTVRHLAAAIACLAAVATSVATAQDAPKPDLPTWFIDMLDSSTLPRIPGALALFESKATSSFVVRDKVVDASEATRALLVADGWQQYVAPFTAYRQDENLSIMSFKKGWQALSVFISVAPAQDGATSIQYTPIVVKNDLPFPKDAAKIEYSPERPLLICITAETPDATLAFFIKALGEIGYSEWSTKTGAKKAPGDGAGEIVQPGNYGYFVHDEKQPLQLLLVRTTDGKLKIELQAIAPDVLAERTKQVKAMAGMVDVTALPRLEGAQIREDRKPTALSLTYMVSGTVPNTIAAVRKLLGENGWVAYGAPLEAHELNLSLKKGSQGFSIFFTTDGNNTNRTGVNMSSERLYNDIPIPPGASDVVFDHTRPLLDTIAPGTVDELLAFFRKELTAADWKPWSAVDAARWPNAKIEETIADGVRAYFTRDKNDRQEPIQVSLASRKDGRVDIEVRVPPFARLQDLKAGQDTYGLPKPDRIKSASGRDGQTRRELTATIPAERDVVLAFYRREMAKLGWKEDARGPVESGDDIVLKFAKPDTTAGLKLGFAYDLTTVSLVQQLPDRIAQERIKAQRDAEEKWRKRAEEYLRAPPRVLEAMKEPTGVPIPVPDVARKVKFDNARGDVTFQADAAVKEITTFYRGALEPFGFTEIPTVIDDEKIASLHFARNGKQLYLSVSKFGERTEVRSYGAGLLAFAADARAQEAMRASTLAPQPALEQLEADESDGLPMPKKHELSVADDSPFRKERNVTVLASLQSTLVFYRRELTRLGWKEEADAIVKAEEASLKFTAPDGPGALTLSRKDGRTVVKLWQRNPAQAAKDGVTAKAGMGRIMIGSIIDSEAVVTINRQTIKVAPGTGQKGGGPKLDLQPGKYKASVKVPGKPAFNEDVTVVAGETLGLLIGPGGVLPLPVY